MARLSAVVLAGLGLQLLLPHLGERTGLVVACAPIAVAGAVAARGFLRQRREHTHRQRVGLSLGVGSGGLLAAAYVLYTIDALVGTGTVAADTLASLSALLGVPAIVLIGPGFPHRLTRASHALDVTMIAGAIFAMVWQLVLADAAAALTPGRQVLMVFTLIPAMIAAALALMMLTRTVMGTHHCLHLLAGSLGVFSLSAIGGAHANAFHLPWYADGAGAAYLIAALLLTLASRATLAPAATAEWRAITGLWSAVPFVPVVLALVLFTVQYARTGTLDPVLMWVLLGASGLAMLRQFFTLMIVKRLVASLEDQRRRLDHRPTTTSSPACLTGPPSTPTPAKPSRPPTGTATRRSCCWTSTASNR
ncbi:hypothetical protein [Actinoplanes sp. NPDC051859]|uniref:hypothetical protein n=1 Tax=Actinoplanes sp. NPDC051859 TaxID=3363909 RepID=UPI0037B93EF3